MILRIEHTESTPIHVAHNTHVAVLGNSITTPQRLLLQIAGAERFDWGEIWLGDLALSQIPLRSRRSELKSRVGLLSESMGFLAGYSVLDNLRFTLRSRRTSQMDGASQSVWEAEGNILTARANELLARTQATDLASCIPSKLSESQRIRIGLAKALSQDLDLLLIDSVPDDIPTAQEREWADLVATLTNLQITVLFATSARYLAELAQQVIWWSIED